MMIYGVKVGFSEIMIMIMGAIILFLVIRAFIFQPRS